MCLETLSTLIKLLGKQSAEIDNQITGSVDMICQLILPKTMKQSLGHGVADNFVNRVDVDVVRQLASLLNNVMYVRPINFLMSQSFDSCINLFVQVMTQVDQAEMNLEIVNFLTMIIDSIKQSEPTAQ